MSNWPSKRKKSGRSHIAKVGMIGMGDKSGTGKKLSSGKIRAKLKEHLQKEVENLAKALQEIDDIEAGKKEGKSFDEFLETF